MQLYEVRWLRDPRYARDYVRYWFRTAGRRAPAVQHLAGRRRAGPSTWSTRTASFIDDLLARLVENYEGWEKEHFDPEVGLFWQTGHDDGMEYNINSRQTTGHHPRCPGISGRRSTRTCTPTPWRSPASPD